MTPQPSPSASGYEDLLQRHAAQPPTARIAPARSAPPAAPAVAGGSGYESLLGNYGSGGGAPESLPDQGFHALTSKPHKSMVGRISDFVMGPGLGTGLSLEPVYDKLMDTLHEVLPKEFQGTYSDKFSRELLKIAPETGDFFTSWAGAALLASHFIPAAAPFAVVGDLLLGGMQGVRTIGSAISAIRDPQDPIKLADAAKDIFLTYGVTKGFKRAAGPAEFKLRPDRPIAANRAIELLRSADPEQKLKIIDALQKPLSKRQENIARLYASPFTSTIASVLDVPKPKLMEAATHLIDDRNSTIGLGKLEVAKLTYDGKREVPVADQDVRKMGYAIEGDAAALQALSPEGKKWVGVIKDWNRKTAKMIDEAYEGQAKLKDPETYLMHRWGFETEGEVAKNWGPGVGRRILRDPQLRKRVIDTYKQGIEEGIEIDGQMVKLKPAMDNVFDILQKRHQLAVTAIANRRVVNTLEGMGLLVSDGEASRGRANPRYNWPKLDSAVVKKPAFVGTQKGLPLMVQREVRVHPDVKRPLEALFGDPFHFTDPHTGQTTALGALEWLRAFGKQQAVGFSFFHNWSITEQAQAIQIASKGVGPKGLGAALKSTFFFNPDSWRGYRSGLFEVVGKPERASAPPILGVKFEAAKDAIKHGLSLETPDGEQPVVEAMRKWMPKNPVLNQTVGRGLRFVGNTHYVLNRGLWDYYLPGQMMFAYDGILERELAKRPNLSEAELAGLKTEVAKHVNKAFGTENLSAMGISPKVKTVLNWVLFAPTWTFSNLRILTNGLQTETARKITGRYIGGAAFSWFVTANLANYATTSWYINHGAKAPDRDGQNRPHFMWDNPGAPIKMGGKWNQDANENTVHVFLGFNENGSERYARPGKNWTEVANWFINPWQSLMNKASLPARTLAVLTTGHEPGSGYQVVDPSAPTEAQWVQRGIAGSELVLPFSLQDVANWAERKAFPEIIPERGRTQTYLPGTPIPLGMPAVQGLSATRAIEAYTEAREDGREDVVEQILKVAQANHISTKTILNGYRQRQHKKQAIVRGPRTVYDELGNVQSPPPSR